MSPPHPPSRSHICKAVAVVQSNLLIFRVRGCPKMGLLEKDNRNQEQPTALPSVWVFCFNIGLTWGKEGKQCLLLSPGWHKLRPHGRSSGSAERGQTLPRQAAQQARCSRKGQLLPAPRAGWPRQPVCLVCSYLLPDLTVKADWRRGAQGPRDQSGKPRQAEPLVLPQGACGWAGLPPDICVQGELGQ